MLEKELIVKRLQHASIEMVHPPQGYHDSIARAEIEKLRKEIKAWKKRSLIIAEIFYPFYISLLIINNLKS